MKEREIKILYLYPDMLELYGDYGNIQVLKYRMEKRNIKCIIDKYSIGDEKPNFCDYDIIFAGGSPFPVMWARVPSWTVWKRRPRPPALPSCMCWT